MKIFSSLKISGSALTAERLRMDVISANIANAQTTRARKVNGKWLPYQRKQVVFSEGQSKFRSVLNRQLLLGGDIDGVRVKEIQADRSEFRTVYQPEHPDADADGFVLMPNVDLLTEMVDLMASQRAYEANITAFNTTKNIYLKALELSK